MVMGDGPRSEDGKALADRFLAFRRVVGDQRQETQNARSAIGGPGLSTDLNRLPQQVDCGRTLPLV